MLSYENRSMKQINERTSKVKKRIKLINELWEGIKKKHSEKS